MIDFVWSDPHFGHANVIKYSERPFADVTEMNETLIDNYNTAVGASGVCLWLGDCFLSSFEAAITIMQRLKGRKILVLGNHDRSAGQMSALGFDIVVSTLTLRLGDHKVRAAHLPYRGMDSREPQRSVFDKLLLAKLLIKNTNE